MLYAVGGYDGSNDLASGESYNAVANKVELRFFKGLLSRFLYFSAELKIMEAE
jgi:hypothetical protein